MSFLDFSLNPKIIRSLDENNYKTPSPIQKKAIPVVANGDDIIACAQTGTGKTAAFSLSLIEKIAKEKESWRRPSVLILSPTRELAIQITENINKYTKYLPVRSIALYGGVKKDTQIKTLKKGVQIIIATPGRLLDHIRLSTVDLKSIQTLVLDEADNMLDMGFIRDVKKIIRVLPRSNRQTLLFSATFSPEIRALSKEILKNPKIIQVAKENKTLDIIKQIAYFVEKTKRKALLIDLIKREKIQQVLIFTKTKHGASRLAKQLSSDGYDSLAIHGNKSQSARQLALDSFKEGKVRILVATDIAARGIDIHNLPFVINFDLPQSPENYVHRIGRTGRAGEKGRAISFVCGDDTKIFNAIESLIGMKIPSETPKAYESKAKKDILLDIDERKENAFKSIPYKSSGRSKGKNKFFSKNTRSMDKGFSKKKATNSRVKKAH